MTCLTASPEYVTAFSECCCPAERTGVCAADGFLAAGGFCGIKSDKQPDIAVVYSILPTAAAAVFTTNRVKSAAVQVSLAHLQQTSNIRAVIFSSGNANAATGSAGLDIANDMTLAVSREFACRKEEVLIGQTGTIGILPAKDICVSGAGDISRLVSTEGGCAAARAIMTTDKKPKIAATRYLSRGTEVIVGGMCKGAGMICPSLATMLALITTDAAASTAILDLVLRNAVDDTFNMLDIDGCCSTNDTVILMANGMSGTEVITSTEHPDYADLEQSVLTVCRSLTRQITADAEGSSKVICFNVHGGSEKRQARQAAKTIAGSLLLKTSITAETPSWGRLVAALGASGVDFTLEKITVSFCGITVFKDGCEMTENIGSAAAAMKQREILIDVDLRQGSACAESFCSDITHAYLELTKT